MKRTLTRAVTRAVIVWGLLACYPVTSYVMSVWLHGGEVHWLAP